MIQEVQTKPNEQLEVVQQGSAEYYEPTRQEYQEKIFINHCNGYIGFELVEQFRNDNEIEVNPNLIIGTLDSNVECSGDLPLSSTISIKDQRVLNSVLKECDVIVYVLEEESARDFEYVVKVLRSMQSRGDRRKKLICVSSILTWNGTRLDGKLDLSDLHARNSTANYLMELQNLCLQLNHFSPVNAYVLAAGLVYGNGEGPLFNYFKRALEQEQLTIYGTGSNLIPMIHVEDLAQMAYELAFHGKLHPPSKSNYYFAVDQGRVTQASIIQTIAQTVGNGSVQHISIEDAFLEDNFQLFTLDAEVGNVPELKQWHCHEGFTHHIANVVSEFNEYRGLKPNKIAVFGPPAAGKTTICEILANAYGLPVISVKKLVDEIREEQGEYADSIRTKLQELKTVKIEEERKAFEEAKKKKKNKKDVEEFDPEKVVPRLPDEDIVQLFRRRLKKSDCQNKGYVLDGWPKSSKQCQELFDEEKILPNSVFFIEANEEQVKERIKNINPDIKEGTHWNEEATARRYQTYGKEIEEGSAKSFMDGKADIKSISFNYSDKTQFVQFVERNGPLGFKKKEDPKKEEEKKEEGIEKPQEEKKNGEEEEQESEKFDDSQEELNIQKLTEHEKTILNEKSRPIRQYLIDNVIPQITEGLLEICKDTPRDPIQFLIKFLESKERQKQNKQIM